MAKKIKLDEVWTLYRKTLLRQLSAGCQKSDISRYNNYIKNQLGHKYISEISELDLVELRASLEDAELSPQSVHHILALVRRILNKAAAWNKYDKRLPSFRDALPRFDNTRIRFFTPEELTKLLACLRKREVNSYWYNVTLFAVSTGLRRAEIFRLKIEHINFRNHTAYVVNTKSKKNRIIGLNPVACAVLASRIRALGDNVKRSDYIFPPKDDRPFRNAVIEAGLNDGISDNLNKVCFHTLRHTFASWLVQSGFPLPLVCQMMGHSSITVTMKYAHLLPTQEWEAYQTINSCVQVFVTSKDIMPYLKMPPMYKDYEFAPFTLVEEKTHQPFTFTQHAPVHKVPPVPSPSPGAAPLAASSPSCDNPTPSEHPNDLSASSMPSAPAKRPKSSKSAKPADEAPPVVIRRRPAGSRAKKRED